MNVKSYYRYFMVYWAESRASKITLRIVAIGLRATAVQALMMWRIGPDLGVRTVCLETFRQISTCFLDPRFESDLDRLGTLDKLCQLR